MRPVLRTFLGGGDRLRARFFEGLNLRGVGGVSHGTAWVRMLLCAAFVLVFQPFLVAKDSKKEPGKIERGCVVEVLRDEPLRFYGKPFQNAKVGEHHTVLEFRESAKQVFVGVKDKGRMVALSLPMDAVRWIAAPTEASKVEKVDALFAGMIPIINLVIDKANIDRLARDPRTYVEASIEEADGKTSKHVAVKLKGSAGSFRGINEKAGFSINTGKFKGGEAFHGMRRFQLNNGAQDGSYLQELIAGEMARKVGIPASRCTHAIVSLNGKMLGPYVLKEGFSEEFLRPFFQRTDGSLFDGGFCAEVHPNMELDKGTSRDGLQELLKAMNVPGPEVARADAVATKVDVRAYMRYLVMENVFCHWDGYSFNRNNYRMYEDPASGKFHFLLHGMDQVFGDTGWSMRREPGAAVGAILWKKPEFRALYDEELESVYRTILKDEEWGERTKAVGGRLVSALEATLPNEAKGYVGQLNGAVDRIRNRVNNIRQQLGAVEVSRMVLKPEGAPLGELPWSPVTDGNSDASVVEFEGRKCLRMMAKGGEANVSWRSPMKVPQGGQGRLRMECQVACKDVVPVQAASGAGGGVRISGGTRTPGMSLSGTTKWKKVWYDFEPGGGEVVLVLELRASAGEMWVDRGSIRLMRAP
jgi:spore coat protein H